MRGPRAAQRRCGGRGGRSGPRGSQHGGAAALRPEWLRAAGAAWGPRGEPGPWVRQPRTTSLHSPADRRPARHFPTGFAAHAPECVRIAGFIIITPNWTGQAVCPPTGGRSNRVHPGNSRRPGSGPQSPANARTHAARRRRPRRQVPGRGRLAELRPRNRPAGPRSDGVWHRALAQTQGTSRPRAALAARKLGEHVI